MGHRSMRLTTLLEATPDVVGKLAEIALNGYVIMFIAAVVEKRWGVWGYIGWWEALPWAAGYGFVQGVVVKKSEK